ncbi:hypothetical protein GYH30_006338 [Glycine max]|uniref:Uncharacterized protein n=1 Tax=Glycine max TaxID=3847 RepID=A0A0R0EDZ4_SOYBN|nr:hypothetical protein GYH30_006338 [Glycine max]
MKLISNAMILSFSIPLLLLSTSYSLYEKPKIHIMTFTFISESHFGIKSFDVELVDQEGNFISFFCLPEDAFFKRNKGTCNGGILPHYWGFGVESRETSSDILDPFVIEQGNPTKVKKGYEEKWLLNIIVTN